MLPKLGAFCCASPLIAIHSSKEETHSDFILALQFNSGSFWARKSSKSGINQKEKPKASRTRQAVLRCGLVLLKVGIHTTTFNTGSGHRSCALCLPPTEGYFGRDPFVHFGLASWDFIMMMPLCSLFLLFSLILGFSILTAFCSCPFTWPPQTQMQDYSVSHHLVVWQDCHWGHWESSRTCDILI